MRYCRATVPSMYKGVQMKLFRAATALFALTLTAQYAAAQTTGSARLERVVIVERHGVRPPTKAPEDLAKFAEQAWPQWSVKPGELTAHGAKAMALMGGALLRGYAETGLVAASPCPAGVFVWSDSGDQRTRASGDAVLQGMGCTGPSSHLAADEKDALFAGFDSGMCPSDAAKDKIAVEAKLSTVLAANRAAYEAARKTMQDILTPNGCGKEGQRACFISEGVDSVVIKNGESRLEGPLANASGLTENLLLEYAEGKPMSEVGWGRAAGKLDSVLTLHNLYADVARRDPVFASRRGSLLAQQIVDLLNNRKSTFQGAAPVPQDAKLIVFLGHDTNLSNMSGFIDTAWSLPGQPDNTAPGTAIAFELWRKADGTKFVTARVIYQTLEELRALTPVSAPHSLALSVCADGRCSLEAISAKISKTVARNCLKQ